MSRQIDAANPHRKIIDFNMPDKGASNEVWEMSLRLHAKQCDGSIEPGPDHCVWCYLNAENDRRLATLNEG